MEHYITSPETATSGGTMGKPSVWHPSRDPYHCTFRMLRIMWASPGKSIAWEWARILDLFVLFPPTLHRVSLPQNTKDLLRKLSIPKPEKEFVRLPSNASLFRDLRPYQYAAMAKLMAHNLVPPHSLISGHAELNVKSVPEEMRVRADRKNIAAEGLMNFLCQEITKLPLSGSDCIYDRAGLPHRNIAQ
ncbi:ABC-three component system middle component 5 [Azospirillum tabaci]|uniref:ABC-three component system middle component 5 n=1 Tax=Azospirillum tabaci TaxID=2752310 RepID=UPI003CCD002F